MPPPTKLRYCLLAPGFLSTSELRDALLQSYPEASYYDGRPVRSIHGGHDTETAWLWVEQLIHQRTDWWPATGIALQHAVHDGGDIARVALADWLQSSRDSMVLLEWTAPLARLWPDRLAEIVATQREHLTQMQGAAVSVNGLEPDGRWISVDVQTQEQLDELLAKSARVGQRQVFGARPTDGPWSWLLFDLLVHERLRPMMVAACATFITGSDPEVRAVLDWFTDEHDLWRYVDLLEGWERAQPSWWSAPSNTMPPGWRYPVRDWLAQHPKTLGDIARAALGRASAQAATPPIVDLPPSPVG